MDYKVTIDNFDGPLDLLLHLIKQSNINITDISILEVTKQYLTYISIQEQMDLNVASEYLVMAASLIEMKSNILLPHKHNEVSDEEGYDPREALINRLIEYKKYKEMTKEFKDLEEERNNFYTKEPSDLKEYQTEDVVYSGDAQLEDLLEAFKNFLDRKNAARPLPTKVTKRELSVNTRSNEIRKMLSNKKRIDFEELFEIYNKEYVVVTFLSILELAKKQELNIKQEDNFSKIYLIAREGVKNE